MRGSRNANPFCVQLAETEPGCKMCVDMQEGLGADSVGGATQTSTCVAGLSGRITIALLVVINSV